MMDVVRVRPGGIPQRAVGITVVLALLCAGGWASLRLTHPAAPVPVVDRASLVTDVARRGPFVRSVAAPGAFVANRIAVVAAPGDGFVEAVLVKPGAHASAGVPIARLRDVALDAEIAELGAEIASARAELRSVADQAEAATIAQRVGVRSARADRQQAEAQATVDETLHAQGLIPDLQYRIARIKVSEARDRELMGSSAVTATVSDGRAKVAAQQAKIAELEGRRTAALARRDALLVTAGTSGTVQSVAVDPGAHVSAGTEIARIASDDDLEAVLQVAESDARPVLPGLPVALTGAGRARGHVARIEPAVVNGTIAVHVALDAPAPFARPAMHVDGAIELERLRDAVSIARPAGAADGVDADLYVLEPGGASARRTRVRLGRGSLDRIVVRAGIAPGDTVIVSDVAADGATRILLR